VGSLSLSKIVDYIRAILDHHPAISLWLPTSACTNKLCYYRARYYSPSFGRFLQTDPVGQQDDLNLYMYVRNDPMNHIDPSGLACVPTLNNASPYCERATMYGALDGKLSAQTRFFAAASATTQALASVDLPLASYVGPSDTRSIFLSTVSRALERLNLRIASNIESRLLTGPTLDARVVHIEQTALQAALDTLANSSPEAYEIVIGEMNAFLNRSTEALQEASTIFRSDAAYGRVLDSVREKLGRDIDFAQ
jgi:hypothetical protein